MFEALRALGYSRSRGPVYEFCKRWREAQDNASRNAGFVLLSFKLGEAFRFPAIRFSNWRADGANGGFHILLNWSNSSERVAIAECTDSPSGVERSTLSAAP